LDGTVCVFDHCNIGLISYFPFLLAAIPQDCWIFKNLLLQQRFLAE
jgi:hypothetical protein